MRWAPKINPPDMGTFTIPTREAPWPAEDLCPIRTVVGATRLPPDSRSAGVRLGEVEAD